MNNNDVLQDILHTYKWNVLQDKLIVLQDKLIVLQDKLIVFQDKLNVLQHISSFALCLRETPDAHANFLLFHFAKRVIVCSTFKDSCNVILLSSG